MNSQKPDNNKMAVRSYMQQRAVSKTPPPSMEEIRRHLGWSMLQGVPLK